MRRATTGAGGGVTQSTQQLGPDGRERPSAPTPRTAVFSPIKQLHGVVDDAGAAPAARRARRWHTAQVLYVVVTVVIVPKEPRHPCFVIKIRAGVM